MVATIAPSETMTPNEKSDYLIALTEQLVAMQTAVQGRSPSLDMYEFSLVPGAEENIRVDTAPDHWVIYSAAPSTDAILRIALGPKVPVGGRAVVIPSGKMMVVTQRNQELSVLNTGSSDTATVYVVAVSGGAEFAIL